jgi:spore maturation protein CgeB
MKILFVGVFDTNRQSTNTSQLLAFKVLGYDVVGYNYRAKAMQIGNQQRDQDLVQIIENRNFDLIVFSKCNVVSYEVFERATKKTKTCLWFMDPLPTYNEEMRRKTSLVSYFCCDKDNVLSEALKINKASFHACEGYDGSVDKPHDIEKQYDISFIGNVYGDRQKMINSIKYKVHLINNAYGSDHAKAVSRTKINLNFCTGDGASDRVYKILAAGGFLLSNDWTKRKEHLTNGRDIVIFDSVEDLNRKIIYYLDNPELRNQISEYGRQAVQKLDRLSWAKKIVEHSYEV